MAAAPPDGMDSMRRRSRVLVVGVLVALLGLGTMVSGASVAGAQDGTWGEAEEQEFVALINELRASKGLPTLAVDLELTLQARIWSTTMRDRGDIFHSGDLAAGVSANWSKLGENVGVGGTARALFDAFVASPTHYANLVDPDYRSIGVGVVWDGNRMFTAHRFMAVFPPKAPAPELPAPAPSPEPSPSPAPSEPPPAAAAPAAAPLAAAAASPVASASDPVRVAEVIEALSSLGL